MHSALAATGQMNQYGSAIMGVHVSGGRQARTAGQRRTSVCAPPLSACTSPGTSATNTGARVSRAAADGSSVRASSSSMGAASDAVGCPPASSLLSLKLCSLSCHHDVRAAERDRIWTRHLVAPAQPTRWARDLRALSLVPAASCLLVPAIRARLVVHGGTAGRLHARGRL